MSWFGFCVLLCILHISSGAKRMDFVQNREAHLSQSSHSRRTLQGKTGFSIQANDASEMRSRTADPFGADLAIEDSTPCLDGSSDFFSSISLRKRSRSILSKNKGNGKSSRGNGKRSPDDDDDDDDDRDDDDDDDDDDEHESSVGTVAGIIIVVVLSLTLFICCCGCWCYRRRRLEFETREECRDRMSHDPPTWNWRSDPFDCVRDILEDGLCCDFFSWALGISRRHGSSGSSRGSDSSDTSSSSENGGTIMGRIWSAIRSKKASADAGDDKVDENSPQADMKPAPDGSDAASTQAVQPTNETEGNENAAVTENDPPSNQQTSDDQLGREESVSAALTEYHSAKSFPSGNLDNPTS